MVNLSMNKNGESINHTTAHSHWNKLLPPTTVAPDARLSYCLPAAELLPARCSYDCTSSSTHHAARTALVAMATRNTT